MPQKPRIRLASRRAPRRGQALAEFALILPLLIFLLLIAIDFGRVFALYVGMNNAAREGAAYGAQRPTDGKGIRDRAKQELGLESTDGSITVTTSCSPKCAPSTGTTSTNTIRVVVSSKFTFLTPFIGSGFPGLWAGFNGNLNIQSSASAVIP